MMFVFKTTEQDTQFTINLIILFAYKIIKKKPHCRVTKHRYSRTHQHVSSFHIKNRRLQHGEWEDNEISTPKIFRFSINFVYFFTAL